MEASEERDGDGLWTEVEGLIGNGDFEAAQDAIDEAAEEGWDVTEIQNYLDREEEKTI